MVASPSPSHGCIEKKYWWLPNKKIVDIYVKDARCLIATHEQSNIAYAINLLDAALALSPRFEMAMELKATALVHLRRFNEVADMLQDYIPSLKLAAEESSSASSSSSSSSSSASSASLFDNNSQPLARERVKLLSNRSEQSVKCFSVSDLKRKVMAGIGKNRNEEGQWRYLILGQACSHLGLMEDAMALLQTGKRLATAAFRRESVCWSDDSFSFSSTSGETFTFSNQPQTPPRTTSSDTICNLLSHIKLLLRRKTAALAAMEAGHYTESIRHFSKIVDGRRCAPHRFLSECYLHRASAYKSSGKIAEALADCNRTLALDPTSIEALTTRSSLFETINCLPDSLHDLEHLKLLYNSILRDRNLPGPAWNRRHIRYHEIPGNLCSISTKIHKLKLLIASGQIGNIDYYSLLGLRRGCSRSELERSYLLLTLRHKPDKSTNFIDRCEFSIETDIESVKDRAKMSSLLLYRLIQRGYTKVMRIVLDEEQRKKGIKQQDKLQNQHQHQQPAKSVIMATITTKNQNQNKNHNQNQNQVEKKNAFQGVFCRDLAVVGNLLSQTGFNRPIQVKYEALSC